MRVYEMTKHETAREMIGYLLVRGGTHILAYAKALEIATGVDVKKMVPIPNLSNTKFDHARKFEAQELGTFYIHGMTSEAMLILRKYGKGINPESGERLIVKQGTPEGAPIPNLEDLPEQFAPGIDRDDYAKIAKRLMENI